jgi:hypothetical protein
MRAGGCAYVKVCPCVPLDARRGRSETDDFDLTPGAGPSPESLEGRGFPVRYTKLFGGLAFNYIPCPVHHLDE